MNINVSIIVPAYNEEKNILFLHAGLKKALENADTSEHLMQYEIIYINDGSTDGTLKMLRLIDDARARVIHFPKNRGKSAALYTGFQEARGKFVITIDADLQSDPSDILKLILLLEEGYDAVFGIRINRKDTFSRKLQSKIANSFANFYLGEHSRDRACPLKGFKSHVAKGVFYFNGMHRFFPTLLRAYRITEIEVRHLHRLHGRSKYGDARRAFNSFRDTLYVKKLMKEGKV